MATVTLTTWVGQIRVFVLDPDKLQTPWHRLVGGTLPVKSRISREPSPLNDASVDVSSGMLVLQAATVLSLGAKPRLWERKVLDVAKLTRVAVEVVGKERRPVAERLATGKMTSHSWPQRWVPPALRQVA